MYMHEGMWLKWVYMYNQQFGQDRHIHEVKTHDHKTCPKWRIQIKMHESSKLDYTSTSNGYK